MLYQLGAMVTLLFPQAPCIVSQSDAPTLPHRAEGQLPRERFCRRLPQRRFGVQGSRQRDSRPETIGGDNPLRSLVDVREADQDRPAVENLL